MVKKLFFSVLFILVIGAGALFIFKERAAEWLLSSRLGLPVSFERLKIDPAANELLIANFKAGNPPQFPEATFIDAPLLKLIVDREALFRGRLRFKMLEIDIRTFTVVKNAEGKLNTEALGILSSPKQDAASESKPPLVDVLRLSVGTVAYKDYSQGDKPAVKVVEVNLKDRSFENVPTQAEIVSIVFSQAVTDTAWKTAVVYGTAAAAGVAVLPVGAAMVVASNDSAQKTVEAALSDVLTAAQAALTELGAGMTHNEDRGRLTANVQGSEVAVYFSNKEEGKVEITVKARKLLIPQPSTAEAVLFQIMENLKSSASKTA